MKKTFFALAAGAVLLAAAAQLAHVQPAYHGSTAANPDTPNTLRVTEEPYASADVLASKYKPLLNYLKRLDIPATYWRAGSYSQYVHEAEKHDIDIAFASTGLASLLVNQYGYLPVLASEGSLNATVFVLASSKLRTLDDLSNSTVLVPEPYDIVTELAKHVLQPVAGRPPLKLQTIEKVDQIMLAVLGGKSEAGVVADFDLELMNPELRSKLRIIARSENVTAHYILLNPGMAAEQQQAITRALQAFAATAEGVEYSKNFGTGHFVPVTDAHMQEMKNFRAFGSFISSAP